MRRFFLAVGVLAWILALGVRVDLLGERRAR